MRIIGVATAPVSFGVFGEPGPDGSGTEPQAVLAAMATAGFDGTELGPPGYFGNPREVDERFSRLGLRVAGAYLPLHLAEPERAEDDLRSMRPTLAALAADDASRAVFADWGTDALMGHPARPWDDRRLALDGDAWTNAVAVIRKAIDLASGYGVKASFHPHIATYVESPWEIDRLLADVEVGLTIDTGHILLAGASPLEVLRAWPDRVDHVHLKDVQRAVMDRAKAEGRRDLETWWADVSCPLGEGDVDLDGFIDGLRAFNYAGWLVVEQDRDPAMPHEFESIARTQGANQRWVRDRLAPDEVTPGSLRRPARPG